MPLQKKKCCKDAEPPCVPGGFAHTLSDFRFSAPLITNMLWAMWLVQPLEECTNIGKNAALIIAVYHAKDFTPGSPSSSGKKKGIILLLQWYIYSICPPLCKMEPASLLPCFSIFILYLLSLIYLHWCAFLSISTLWCSPHSWIKFGNLGSYRSWYVRLGCMHYYWALFISIIFLHLTPGPDESGFIQMRVAL